MKRNQRSYIYIPPSAQTARRHVKAALSERLTRLPKRDFLKGYCSVAYLHPAFHPDDWHVWVRVARVRPFLQEVWRRFRAGELTDNELYPYQATKAPILQAQRTAARQVE